MNTTQSIEEISHAMYAIQERFWSKTPKLMRREHARNTKLLKALMVIPDFVKRVTFPPPLYANVQLTYRGCDIVETHALNSIFEFNARCTVSDLTTSKSLNDIFALMCEADIKAQDWAREQIYPNKFKVMRSFETGRPIIKDFSHIAITINDNPVIESYSEKDGLALSRIYTVSGMCVDMTAKPQKNGIEVTIATKMVLLELKKP